MRTICALALCGASLAMSTLARAQDRLETGDEALGRTAAVGGDVPPLWISTPDLQVTLTASPSPALALGGWLRSSRCTARSW